MGYFGKQQTVAPVEHDPLYSRSGGAELRSGIFGDLPSQMQSATAGAKQAQGAARAGAASMAPVGAYGQRVLAGDYLRSNPYLDQALAATRQASDTGAAAAAQQARSGLATQQADTQSQFARRGQTFGTAGQLAQENATAGLEAEVLRAEQARQAQLAAGETAARAENFARERQNQQMAPAIIQQAATTPTSLLQAVPGLEYAGVSPAVEVIRGLASGAPVVNPNTYYKPGAFDYTMQGLGAAGAAGGAGF